MLPLSSPHATEPFALFEDNLHRHTATLLSGHLASLSCNTAATVDHFFNDLEAHRAQGHWIALVAHYELGTAFYPQLSATTAPLAHAHIFQHSHTLANETLHSWWQDQLAALSPQQRDAGVLHLRPGLTQEDYLQRVARILDYIAAGDCYQANFTFPLNGQIYGHPLALYAQLRQRQAVREGGLLFDGQNWLLSRSPELFFTRQGDTVSCRPMKGTARRDADPVRDQSIAQALQSSEKNRAENLMIVDLIRNDLGRLAPPGGVQVEQLFTLESYSTVHQLTSSVRASPIKASLGELFSALHPCGSVTGAPKLRAMQILQSLEIGPRGPYCGAFGWIAPSGDCHFNVPIRTLEIDAQQNCRLGIGSGIVADSAPQAEYQECLDKAAFVQNDGLQLIETMLYQPAENPALPFLAGHLQRLKTSAEALNIPCDIAQIARQLNSLTTPSTAPTQRLRLTLDRQGQAHITCATLETTTARTVIIAQERLDPSDLRLQHKTTARSFYDAALKQALAAGHFDVLYLNTRNELCEGARSNLFIQRGGKLLTPAQHCGLLPGVLRATLLGTGEATEAVLGLDDVLSADKVFLGNALRGLVEVSIAY